MRHRKAKVTLDRKTAARSALLKNLATSAILYERIKTTEAKAHAVQPLVERLIGVAQSGSLADRRRLHAALATDGAVKKLIMVIAPRYKDRRGGYTRITKIGRRQGDAARMATLEFV